MTLSTNYAPPSSKRSSSEGLQKAIRFVTRALVFPFLFIIRLYQSLLSPFLRPACRFYPSCSHYAYDALDQHGLARGGYLATRRVLRCHPGHPGGVDPVPER